MEQTLALKIRKSGLPYLFPLFQQGIILKTQVGGNVKELLSTHWELDPDYVEKRIQTIFLDGKAVDNLEEAYIRDGSTLALSAAMPGLVGATLRRGGAFASLRQAITFSPEKNTGPHREGRIILKLFNLLVPELGPSLLAKGFWLEGENLNQFIKGLQKEFWQGCQEVIMNGRKIAISLNLPELRFEKEPLIFFRINFLP